MGCFRGRIQLLGRKGGMTVNFSMIGNINTHLKTMKMQMQWDLKRQSGNYSAKGESLDQWLDSPMKKTAEAAQVQAQVDAQRENGDDKLREIHQKLEAGGKLTAEERKYLQVKDPEKYRELVAEEQEQKAYEQALRRCTTKEEVERLRMSKLGSSLMKVQSVEHNPAIPLSKKLEIAMAEKRRTDAVAESTQRFVESGEYAKLPTESEEWQASQEAQEQNSPQKPEGPQGPEREPAAVPGEDAAAKSGREPAKVEDSPKEEREKPAVETESEAARKVRRAKAQAAYHTASQTEIPQAQTTFTRDV